MASALFERILKQSESIKNPAVIENDVIWSYSDLKDKAIRLASSLQAKGISAGDKVAVMLMNQKEYIVSVLAIRYLDAVVVPLNIQMPPDDIRFIIQHSETRLIIATEQFACHLSFFTIPLLVANQTESIHPSWEDAVEKGSADFVPKLPEKELEYPNLHVLIYTSGTTGQPKGVMLSDENLIANMDGIDPVLSLKNDDRALLALPIFHAYGLMIGLYLLDQRGTIVLVPNFAPKKIIEALITHQVTVLPLVPTMFSVLLQAIKKVGTDSFKSLRACVSGGASLPAALLKQVESELNVVVIEGYGMTETSPVLCVNDYKVGSIPGSVGKPLPNIDLKLVDGEIRVKGPNVMAGYYKNPEATKETFDDNGYLKTGDLGTIDEKGNVYISGGRIKDLIIKAGENISPIRIEQVLYQHPAIQDASVIGVADEKLGEDILACIQLKPEYREGKQPKEVEKELKKFCLEHLTPLLVPAYFRIYDELPKNATGKILKKVLREENPTVLAKSV